MEQADLVMVVLKLREQIDFLWKFYVTSCAILIGWIFSSKIKWTQEKGNIISILFILFAIVNLLSLYSEYSLMQLGLDDLKTKSMEAGSFVSHFSTSKGLGAKTAIFLHFIVDLAIFGLLKRTIDLSITNK